MAQWIRQNTAVVIHIGPAVATGGLAAVTTLKASVVTALKMIKHGSLASVAPTSVTGRTFGHKADGHYSLSLLSGDTNTPGHLTVYVRASGAVKALPFWGKYHVVPPNVYDALVSGSAKLNVGTLASAAVVWTAATRLLTSGSVLWAATPRTLTSGASVASSVWTRSSRLLTSGSVIWSATPRTLTSGLNVASSVWSKAQTELSGVPVAAPAAGSALMFLYMSSRNKRITTATGDKIHTSATVVVATAPISASSITFTKNKYA